MNIYLNAPINTQTSYGITGLNLIQSLSKLGHTVNAYPIGTTSYYPYQNKIRESVEREKYGKPHIAVKLYHQHSLFETVGEYHIGFPIFELNKFSNYELQSLSHCDELWVCSQWAKDIVDSYDRQTWYGLPECQVVPLGVNSEVFSPQPLFEKDDFAFFFPGKFEYRKGFDIVADVFDAAFPTENVQLIFLPTNLFIKDNEDWARSLFESNLGKRGKIQISPRLDNEGDVVSLYAYSDCVVSFSRAEGWNLPLLEALSCGRQVIATNYSGHTEFLNHENAHLIDIKGMEEANDGIFFHGDGEWADISKNFDDFVDILREVYKKGRQFNQAGVKTSHKFSWENSAKAFVKALNG